MFSWYRFNWNTDWNYFFPGGYISKVIYIWIIWTWYADISDIFSDITIIRCFQHSILFLSMFFIRPFFSIFLAVGIFYVRCFFFRRFLFQHFFPFSMHTAFELWFRFRLSYRSSFSFYTRDWNYLMYDLLLFFTYLLSFVDFL